MNARTLLIAMALIEATAGPAVAIAPAVAVPLLIGAPLDAPAAIMLARVAGSALFTLGIVCWRARADGGSPAGRGVLAGMLFYNAVVAGLLAYCGTALRMAGPLLWPCVPLHAAIAVACWLCLRRPRT